MSVCRKLPDGTIQKIAGHTILLDANASEVREGIASINTSNTGETHVWQINFTDPMPDTDYMVIPYFGDEGVAYGEMDVRTQWKIYNKTVTGCKASYYSQFTQAGPHTIHYIAWKPIKLDGYTALQNKVNNPDETPTINSMNLVTSDGVARAIKNASAVWKGTKAEWNALPAAEKQTYDLAVLLDKTLVKAVDREDGTETDVANLNKIVHLTKAEYDAMPSHDPDTYYMITDDVTGGGGAFAPVGMIAPFAGSTAPTGWLLCNGQAVSRTDYAKLFNVIGTTYGGGNGSTTFNIPDMRESVPKGIGENPKGASHVKAGGLTLGEFQNDRNKAHSHTMSHTHTMAHTHTRGNMDITGSMNFGYGDGTFGGYAANGAFYGANWAGKSGIGNAAGSDPARFDGVVFQASRNWSGATSEPSNANTGGSSAVNTGTDGGTTTEVKSVGVNYIIKY